MHYCFLLDTLTTLRCPAHGRSAPGWQLWKYGAQADSWRGHNAGECWLLGARGREVYGGEGAWHGVAAIWPTKTIQGAPMGAGSVEMRASHFLWKFWKYCFAKISCRQGYQEPVGMARL